MNEGMGMNEVQRSKWEQTRKIGRRSFILRYGVLGWGVPTAILFSVFMSLKNGASFLSVLPLAIVLFPVGGIAFGGIMWALSERQFAKLQQSDK